ncbi:MAG: 2-C-methyl-D-erythritol 4-phosphate cytidylyltransferase [Bacteroidetes bacterium SB0662_bin_6]|nr:2-C-methyl-D-erythritol 4-phosphate cytidylyltransferase [Bacteroidetes bacterium SB0668_bin_1]MYE03444.1 2-C-methyl-D-erythritol 4-phosphate cytidylyltransferase [Bacteroidetes bacterium SB0662_bin_6]
MGGSRKQYRNLGGVPLLVQTLRVFERHPRVDYIVVAAPAGDADWLASDLHTRGFRKIHTVISGGASRQASVAAALDAAPSIGSVSSDMDIVLVHDAVRPFVPAECIDAVISAALEEGAASLALPVADTLRAVSRGVFAETVDRERLCRMQTPQAFRRDWLEEAHRAARSEERDASDDVALVQDIGRPVVLVEGSALNIKVTTPADYELAGIIQSSFERTSFADT